MDAGKLNGWVIDIECHLALCSSCHFPLLVRLTQTIGLFSASPFPPNSTWEWIAAILPPFLRLRVCCLAWRKVGWSSCWDTCQAGPFWMPAGQLALHALFPVSTSGISNAWCRTIREATGPRASPDKYPGAFIHGNCLDLVRCVGRGCLQPAEPKLRRCDLPLENIPTGGSRGASRPCALRTRRLSIRSGPLIEISRNRPVPPEYFGMETYF